MSEQNTIKVQALYELLRDKFDRDILTRMHQVLVSKLCNNNVNLTASVLSKSETNLACLW